MIPETLHHNIMVKCAAASKLVEEAHDLADELGNEIVARWPQYFSGYLNGMGLQNFYWSQEILDIMAGDQQYFVADECLSLDEMGYSTYTEDENDTVFVPFPDELKSDIRLYLSAANALNEFLPGTFAPARLKELL